MKTDWIIPKTKHSLIQGPILLVLSLLILGCTNQSGQPNGISAVAIHKEDSVLSLKTEDSLSVTNKFEMFSHRKMVEDYLEKKKIEPTSTYVNDGSPTFSILNHKISWKEEKKGIEIAIDGKIIRTSDKITRNIVWGQVDSVNFANFLDEVKIYESHSIMLFTLRYVPCTGLGCGVEYQLLYDLKTGKQSYFGSFFTGFDAALYNFNGDEMPDFLSTTFHGRNEKVVDTTVCTMYSQTKRGYFQEYKTDKQERCWFKLIEAAGGIDSVKQGFKENWVEKIMK